MLVTGTAPIPLPAAANLALWLSADKGVSAAAGSVSAWEDQSGNLNNAAQADAGLQPQLVDNAVNNKPVIRFDGANDYLSCQFAECCHRGRYHDLLRRQVR